MKIFKFCLIAISLVMTIINIWKAITTKLVVNWFNLTSLAPILIALYYEWDWLFINWNKRKSWLLNKTVSFKASFYLYLDNDSVEKNKREKELSNAINDAIQQSGFIYQKKKKISIPYTRIILMTQGRLKFTLDISGGDHGTPIVISMDYQISSKNITQCWKNFKTFQQLLAAKFITQKQRYDILLDFSTSKQNPFYRLTLKSLDTKEVATFRLNFVEGEMRVDICNNQLHASSKKLVDIDKILSEYVPLTHVI